MKETKAMIDVTSIRNEDGMLERHGNTYDITIRCRGRKEYDAVLAKLNSYGEWTPVTEKLPDIHDCTKTYLATLTNGDVVISRYTETRGRHWWTHYGIVAWMPLPDRYKEDAE